MSNARIFYICDRKACPICFPDCNHTSNIKHAVNFQKKPPEDYLICDQYWEKEVTNNAEMDTPVET